MNCSVSLDHTGGRIDKIEVIEMLIFIEPILNIEHY